MVPLKLTLKNFLSYGENPPTLDFRNFDIACLTGKNGHGKSALIDALTWALWGKCRVKVKEEVIRRGASEGSVELEFEAENNVYRIFRVIKRKKGGTSSSINLSIFDTESGTFKPFEEGSKTQNAIEDLLKMDYNSFICSSFILQGMADEFTKRTPSERKEILSTILALDEYELITKKAREHTHILSSELNALQNQENQLKEEISEKSRYEEKLQRAKIEDKKLATEIIKFETTKSDLIAEYESIKANLEKRDKLLQEFDQNQRKFIKLESDLKNLLSLISKDKDIVFKEEVIVKGFQKYELSLKKEKILSAKELTKSKLEVNLETVQNLIKSKKAEIEGELKSLETKYKGIEKNLVNVRAVTSREKEILIGYRKFNQLNNQEKALDSKKNIMLDLNSKQVEVDNKIEQKRIEIETTLFEIKSKVTNLKSKSEQKKDILKEIKNLNLQLKEANNFQNEMDINKQSLSNLRERKSSITSRIIDLEKLNQEEILKMNVLNSEITNPHCPLCESPLEKEAKEALIEKLKATVSNLQNKIVGDKTILEQLISQENTLLKEITNIESKTKDMSTISKELGEKEQSLKESEFAAKELERTKKELESLTKQIRDKKYIQGFNKDLSKLEKKRAELKYNAESHLSVKKEVEKYRKFVIENEILKSDKIKESKYAKELKEVKSKIGPINKILEQESFSKDERQKVFKIETALNELGYDEKNHKKLKSELDNLKKFQAERENLEKAKLGLSIREKEQKKLSLDLADRKKKNEDIQIELKKLKDISAKSKEIKQQLESSTNRINLLRKNKNEIVTEITRSENQLERIEKLTKDRKSIGEKIKKTNRDLSIYKELVKAFGKNGLQALIIENVVPEIEIEANNILNKLTDGNMALSLEMVKPTKAGGAKETLEIYIGDSSGTRSYETFSGGEAFRIDFALRVAISKFIANRSGAQLRTLVVDEGFGTQDKDGLDQFVQVLNIVKDDFEKILAITHVEELKERFPVRIEVTKEADQGSSFEVIYT